MSRLLTVALFALMFSRLNAQLILPADSDNGRLVNLSNLAKDSETMIALVFGQSNAANRGQTPCTPHNTSVFNYYEGKLYRAKDPLIGNTGVGGSVWTHLADMLIDSGRYKKVILVPIAIGGSEIACWTSGDCAKKLDRTLAVLDSQHISLTHIFWHQGETDNLNNTTTAIYKEHLTKIYKTVRKYQSADFYIALASYHPSAVNKPLGVDSLIRNAQQEFISENKSVVKGPDTDQLIYAIYRYDSVHFSDFGLKVFAQLWMKAIKERKE